MMEQPFLSDNFQDAEGNPAGGWAEGEGFRIDWQDGPLGRAPNRAEPNGAFVETIMRACLRRLHFYQEVGNGKFACRQNALAITKLEESLHWLQDRTAEREIRGVEGTHVP